MTTPANPLSELRAAGFSVRLSGDSIAVTPKMTPEMVERYRDQKTAIVDALVRELTQDTAVALIALLPDHAAQEIDALLAAAIGSNWLDAEDLALSRAVVEAYAEHVDPGYRSQLWGGTTLAEAKRRRRERLAREAAA
jgi:cytochrome P450